MNKFVHLIKEPALFSLSHGCFFSLSILGALSPNKRFSSKNYELEFEYEYECGD